MYPFSFRCRSIDATTIRTSGCSPTMCSIPSGAAISAISRILVAPARLTVPIADAVEEIQSRGLRREIAPGASDRRLQGSHAFGELGLRGVEPRQVARLDSDDDLETAGVADRLLAGRHVLGDFLDQDPLLVQLYQALPQQVIAALIRQPPHLGKLARHRKRCDGRGRERDHGSDEGLPVLEEFIGALALRIAHDRAGNAEPGDQHEDEHNRDRNCGAEQLRCR